MTPQVSRARRRRGGVPGAKKADALPLSQTRNLIDQHQPGSGRESSPREPFITLDDLFWFLYLYPFRLLAALGFPKLIYRLGALFRFRVKQRVEVVTGRMLAA